MDKIRIALWAGLLASIWFSYTVWIAEHPPAPAPEQTAAPERGEGPPPVLDQGEGEAAPAIAGQAPAAAAEAERPTRTIRVLTDVLDVVIDLDGGDMVEAVLPRYPVDKKNPDVPVRLLNYDPDTRWVFQTGVAAPGEAPAPNHQQAYRADRESYRLEPGADTLTVRLEWIHEGPIHAAKVYTFRRGDYEVDLDLVVSNDSTAPWQGAGYARMSRVNNPVKRHYARVETYSFKGPVLFSGDRYQKLDFDELRTNPVMEEAVGGWIASIQHHFLAAAVPPPDEETTLDARTSGPSYLLTATGPVEEIAPSSELTYPLKLFVGPKLQQQLRATAPKLDLTVDYGRLTFLSHPLFLLLEFVHRWVGNWGWSIVISTLLIKLAFYKLTATSGRSMAKMRKLAPRMKALQEKYKDDRQALSQAMMEMYKREKVNPAAGCLPILIQMPVFIAFYWVLVETAEMRQAPFMFWINDLSTRDPYFVLPILIGAAMFFQMRLNPTPPDPTQARIMQIMPFAFMGMFALFPAGMELYYMTNTLFSIAQQWRINKLVARES